MTQKFLPLLTALLVLIGCQHAPSPTGFDALPSGDVLGVLSFDSQRDSARVTTSTTLHIGPGATAQFLSIGRTAEYTCYSLIRWSDLPGDIDYRGKIVAAKLTLYGTNYGIGPMSTPFGFAVKEITSAWWNTHTSTADSMRAGSVVTRPEVKGRFSGIVGDSIEIELDTTMVRTWLHLMADGRFLEIGGMLLEPDPSNTTIRAFESGDPRPSNPNALNARGPKLTLVMDLNTGMDTTIYPSPVEDTYVLVSNDPVPSGLVAAGGIAYRGKLDFDVSRIPAGSIINSAALYLTLDESLCRRSYRGIDSVYVFESLSGNKDSTAIYAVTSEKLDSGILRAQGGATLALVRAVQRWVNDPQNNHGLILVKTEETSDLDYLAFYGDTAPFEKRPRLVVTYTQRP